MQVENSASVAPDFRVYSGCMILNAVPSPLQGGYLCTTPSKCPDPHAVELPLILHFDYNSTRKYWQMNSPFRD